MKGEGAQEGEKERSEVKLESKDCGRCPSVWGRDGVRPQREVWGSWRLDPRGPSPEDAPPRLRWVAELHPGGTTALGCAGGSRLDDPRSGETGGGFLCCSLSVGTVVWTWWKGSSPPLLGWTPPVPTLRAFCRSRRSGSGPGGPGGILLVEHLPVVAGTRQSSQLGV